MGCCAVIMNGFSEMISRETTSAHTHRSAASQILHDNWSLGYDIS